MIKTEYKITFKIRTGYYLELLTTETMKLLGRTKSKITKDSKWAILSIARNFTNKLYLFKKS